MATAESLNDESLIINFKKNLLDDHLKCTLCSGYFNFAHTLVDCGHTFCRMCIYSHFKKNKVPKCPICESLIEKNFSKSVQKDPYKQNLVDLIHPDFYKQDQEIIKRCRLLFPDFDIQTIKEELDSNWEVDTRKRSKKIFESKLKKNLNETVQSVFGFSLDQFSKDIQDNDKFNQMMQSKIDFDKRQTVEKSAQDRSSKLLIHLYPKTPKDQEIVKIRNVISVQLTKIIMASQIKKFIFDSINRHWKDKEAPFDHSDVTVEKIQLLMNDKEIGDFQHINELKKQVNDEKFMIHYHLSFLD